jgi:hypothetical protein
MNGAKEITSAYLPTASGQAWKIVGVGDFNGDGKPDILWRNTSTGQNLVWYMNGAKEITSAYLPTASGQAWTIVGIY